MGRPKKGDVDELEAVNQDIEAQTERLRKLREKQKRLQEADNIKLGKQVKSIFKDMLPSGQKEREMFFVGLVKSASVNYSGTEDLSSILTAYDAKSKSVVTGEHVVSGSVLQQESAVLPDDTDLDTDIDVSP